jgi:putative tricarboxylic transport membrane protein
MAKAKWKCVGLILFALVLGAAPAWGAAAKYPAKTVTFVAPSGAGGTFDVALRVITKALSDNKIVDQQMLVEAKPGGGGSVFLTEYVLKDSKNDYKLFLTSPTMLINNLKKEGYCPYTYKNTTPLAQFFVDFSTISVPANSKYKDFKSLMNDVKADPKKLSWAGGSGPGAVWHLAFLLPAAKYGIPPKEIKYISYDGNAQALTAMLGGNADVLSAASAAIAQYVEAGRIRVLAVNAPQRLGGVFKNVPTLRELGVQADFDIWRGVFGPAQMSADAKAYWLGAFDKLSKLDSWQKELDKRGWDADYKSGDAFTKTLDQQHKDIGDLLKTLDMAK